MRKLYDLYGIYLPIFLLILPFTVALRTVALFTDLAEYGHFSSDLLVSISGWTVAAAALFFATYMLAGKKSTRLIPSFDSAANYIPSGLVATAIAMLGTHLLSLALKTDLKSASLYVRIITVATPALAFVAVIYFVFASIVISRRSTRRSDFAIVTLLFICMYVAYLYFDTTLPINAPTRIVDEIAYLAIAMFFLGEARLSLGRERWRSYISFAFIGALMTAYSSIPNLIYYLAREKTVSLSVYESILTFAFFIFIVAKIFLTPMLTKDETSGVVEKIIAASAARAEALEPAAIDEQTEQAPESTAEADENQITITYEYPDNEQETDFALQGEEKEAQEE